LTRNRSASLRGQSQSLLLGVVGHVCPGQWGHGRLGPRRPRQDDEPSGTNEPHPALPNRVLGRRPSGQIGMVVGTPQARPPSRLGRASTASPADARSDIGPGPASGADVVSGPEASSGRRQPPGAGTRQPGGRSPSWACPQGGVLRASRPRCPRPGGCGLDRPGRPGGRGVVPPVRGAHLQDSPRSVTTARRNCWSRLPASTTSGAMFAESRLAR
jgi:hypothetical protein